MSARIRRNIPLLEKLYKARAAGRRVILNNAGPDFLNALCEIALNILKGRIPLTHRQYTQLQRQSSGIRIFASKRTSIARKKRLVNQKGGAFFLPLLSAALPFITSLFSRS